jgi:hypothetical protein
MPIWSSYQLCSYEINNDRTGLLLVDHSEYKHEEEVLVVPYKAFLITAVRRAAPNNAEIDLRECEVVNEDNEVEIDDDDDDNNNNNDDDD